MAPAARLLQIYLATAGRSLRREPKEQCSYCLRDRAEVDFILAGPRACRATSSSSSALAPDER